MSGKQKGGITPNAVNLRDFSFNKQEGGLKDAYKKKSIRILEELRELLGSDAFKNCYRMSERDFTRQRVLTFVGLVVSQINLMSKSLSVEVSRFVERFFHRDQDYSKQAFSQRRSKLKPAAFTALNRRLVSQYYADGDYTKWQGYLLLAVDGSTLQFPPGREFIAAFGLAENKGKSMPMGRSSLLYDVENGLVVDALLEEYMELLPLTGGFFLGRFN